MKAKAQFTAEQKEELFKRLTLDNVERVKICAWIVMVLEFLMIIRSYILNGTSFNQYFILYISLFLGSLCLIIGMRVAKTIANELKRLRLKKLIMVTYYLFMMLWGAIVTVLDQSSYGHVTAYLTNVMAVTVLYITSVRAYIGLHILPVILLVVGLIFSQENIDVRISHFINIIVFLIFCFMGSRMIYKHVRKMFLQEIELSENNTKLATLNSHLKRISVVDDLTNIPNRRGLYDYIETEVSKTKQHFTAMVLDIDAFKLYNDCYGHLPGNEVLYKVAQEIERVARKSGLFVARFGGEEFIVLGKNLSDEKAHVVAEDIRSSIEGLQIEHCQSYVAPYITISLGYASAWIHNDRQFDCLINNADLALYKVKQTTRNAVASK